MSFRDVTGVIKKCFYLLIYDHSLFLPVFTRTFNLSFTTFLFKGQNYWRPSCRLLPLPPDPHPVPLLLKRTCDLWQSLSVEKYFSAKHNDNNDLHCACDEAAAPLHDVCREIHCCGATPHLSTVKKKTDAQITFIKKPSLIRALLRYNVVFTNAIFYSEGSLILV